MNARETEAPGSDHSAIGAWLLEQWAFPAQFVYTTLASHDPSVAAPPPNLLSLARHVHVARLAGDLRWRRDRGDCVRGGAGHAAALLAIDEETYIEALTSQVELLREAATIFNVNLGDTTAMSLIESHACEALATPELCGTQAIVTAPIAAPAVAVARTKHGELTGLYNRDYIDRLRDVVFASARRSNAPLSLVSVRLDRFDDLVARFGEKSDGIIRLRKLGKSGCAVR